MADDAGPACIVRNIVSGNWVDVAMQQAGACNSGIAVSGGTGDTLAAFLAGTHASLG